MLIVTGINMKNEIVVKSIISAKEAEDLKIKHKAVAGISEAELIKRHTIGEYDKDNKEDNEEEA